jgi:hypothetical protein
VSACLPADYPRGKSNAMHPMRKVEFATHTILATIDVLSTVFRVREHTAHVRPAGK